MSAPALPYRVTVIDPRHKRRRSAVMLFCLDDAEAMAMADRHRLFCVDVEVWQGSRLVARLGR